VELSIWNKAAKLLNRCVSPEGLLIAAFCFVDMVSTIYVVRTGRAIETNPLLAPSLQHGNIAFVLLKSASFLLPLAVLEMIRPLNPKFIGFAMRCGVALYPLAYVVGELKIHHLM
jgi:hypothetical protein